MKHQIIILLYALSVIYSCKESAPAEINEQKNLSISEDDTISNKVLFALTEGELMQYGSPVAYLNTNGDTIIPFGKYAYLGSDSLHYFANVMEMGADSTIGRWVAIDGQQNVLYEIVPFDNGPDYFVEGFVRAKRNGKIGFADQYGQIVIPCEYDFACPFEGGKAKVTYKAIEAKNNQGDQSLIDSDEWFYIDKDGQKIN